MILGGSLLFLMVFGCSFVVLDGFFRVIFRGSLWFSVAVLGGFWWLIGSSLGFLLVPMFFFVAGSRAFFGDYWRFLVVLGGFK